MSLSSAGVLDVDGGITVDNITIDGQEIDVSSGDLLIDVEGDINLDANGADVRFQDNGTVIGAFTNDSSDFVVESKVQDKDLSFRGNDGGSVITALNLDMSADGHATFKNGVTLTDGDVIVASGHGIDFSATSDLSAGDATPTQELFDDYEEGTWTATISSASGTVTASTSNDECTYVKIGRHVFLNGSIGISSVSSPSGRLTIDGKPFNTTGGEGGHRGAGLSLIHI